MRALAILFIALLTACAPIKQQPAQTDKTKLAVLSDQIKALCTNPDYAAYFAKTFCVSTDATLAKMTDKSVINAQQKEALNAWSQAYDRLAIEMNQTMRTGNAKDKKMAAYYDNIVFPAAQQNRLNLYDGKITWGEYNRHAKEIYEDTEAEIRRIFQ